MSLLDNICLRTKIATVCFVLGKMTFMPSVYFLFSDQRDLALTSIYLYISLIVASLAFSISAIKSKKIDTSMLKNKIKLSESDENTFTVIVKDGKIVSIK